MIIWFRKKHILRECNTCGKHGTLKCPNSKYHYSTDESCSTDEKQCWEQKKEENDGYELYRKILNEQLEEEIERMQRIVNRYESIPECKLSTRTIRDMENGISYAKKQLQGNNVWKKLEAHDNLNILLREEEKRHTEHQG